MIAHFGKKSKIPYRNGTRLITQINGCKKNVEIKTVKFTHFYKKIKLNLLKSFM